MSAMYFFIPGAPVAQGRGRAVSFGGKARVVDPTKSRGWKATLGTIALSTMRERAWPIFGAGVPLSVTIVALFARPKRLLKKNSDAEALPKVGRPDIDNLVKSVLDGLNRIAYHDDSAVVEIHAQKLYVAIGEDEGVGVTVEEHRSYVDRSYDR